MAIIAPANGDQVLSAFDRAMAPPVGAGERSRTPDLLITNQLLYRLSYASTVNSLE